MGFSIDIGILEDYRAESNTPLTGGAILAQSHRTNVRKRNIPQPHTEGSAATQSTLTTGVPHEKSTHFTLLLLRWFLPEESFCSVRQLRCMPAPAVLNVNTVIPSPFRLERVAAVAPTILGVPG